MTIGYLYSYCMDYSIDCRYCIYSNYSIGCCSNFGYSSFYSMWSWGFVLLV